ncbi:MAG TPA: response regulator [Pyrinomonadaceae bacterium]|nr:response regulator [Pyrinomonadaceae bacterium]
MIPSCLVRLARSLAHRHHIPILIFSQKNCPEEARQAGANDFLQKPDFLVGLITTVKQLIETRHGK